MASLLPLGIITQIAAQVITPCFFLLAVLGVGSGIDYVLTWGSKAYREDKKRKLYKHAPRGFRRLD